MIALSWPREAGPTDRLPFSARSLDRLSFISPTAENLWRDRLTRLIEVAVLLEFDALRHGKIISAQVWAPYRDLAAFLPRMSASGFATTLECSAIDPSAPAWADGESIDPQQTLSYRLRIAPDSGASAEAKGENRSAEENFVDAGFPCCCAEAWAKRMRAGGGDPLAFLLRQGENGPLVAYTALGALGMGPLRHASCRPTCAVSMAGIDRFFDAMRSLGFAEEAKWLAELSGGRVRYSIRSGIAEISTALFKFAYRPHELAHVPAENEIA